MTAEFSECGTYRYTLTRLLSSPCRWVRPALFIMLNPSTADATNNDPTIRRCISFAERSGCTHLTVVNLFALRATDPRELKKHHDPVGPFNDRHIALQIMKHHDIVGGLVVAAWGAHPLAKERADYIFKTYGDIKCLGTTMNGSPRHPLYVKSTQSFVEWK